jgi:hypothetical protein
VSFEDLGGIYDKNIIGSGDTFLVDCFLDSWDIHGFVKKFTDPMKVHMLEWCERLKKKQPVLDYVPVDIWHLWHGSLKNRRYMDRHDVILKYNYDPLRTLCWMVRFYEWASDKPGMHEDIRQYFYGTKGRRIVIRSLIRNGVPFVPALVMLGLGAMVESLPLVLIGSGLVALHYELYKIKIKIENSQPWY